MTTTTITTTPPLRPADAPSAAGFAPGRTPVSRRVQLRGMTRDELQTWLVDELGEKRFRADQLFQWLHCHGARSFDEMTNLSKKLRERLADVTSLSAIEPHEAYPAADGTTKLTFRLEDGAVVESVVIPADGRVTLCISSQVGCAINCQFCLTARMGLVRNLTSAEIVDQVAWARQIWEPQAGRRISNLVFMGMGEPLHNYTEVTRALRVLLDGRGMDFSRRKITVSTSGLVPAIERFGQEPDLDVNLAVSLNATTDAVRDQVMPINKRWNMDALLTALRAYPLRARQRITFEYVMLAGVNDTLDDARRLVGLMEGLAAKVNLIPWNPFEEGPYKRPDADQVSRFQQFLLDQGINATVRVTRGLDAMAACGQLGQPGQADRWREAVKEARRLARAERLDAATVEASSSSSSPA